MDSLETQVVFVNIFAYELEIFEIAVQKNTKTAKMMAFVRNCLVKMTLRLF